jgi:transcriptional regulator with PAS, ATPase and Fis domain
MPIQLQTKLLKVIQERKSRKVGGVEEELVTCRFVAASNRLLNHETKEFREDLYWRISTFELFTIPLRNRPEDIEPILRHLDSENKLPQDFYNKIIPEKLKGNVRSLEQYVRRYLILNKLP